ncbi:MAG: hypothetical protein K6T66_05640 [Peptococcaceae bacterium]|nr:hypothetical protein [Peptococcaceae bacterium]
MAGKLFDRLKRITIFTGSLGSGKTEVAVNTALGLMRLGKKAALVDLDIINPYFRTRLVRKQLEEMGLRVVSPEGRFSFADLPALSPAVKGVIENGEITGVFDVGGDDAGAVALGRYRDILQDREFGMLFVINACRPYTREPEGIIRNIDSIQEASGIKVSGLVNNTNLGGETGLDTVLDGFSTVSRVSEMTGLPVCFTAVKRDLEEKALKALGGKTDVLALDKFMKTPWEG